jgi:hypothetical protein
MSRPKSSWGEIFGAIGALSAAQGAHRAADEVRNLQKIQQQSLAVLQDHLQLERQRHEAEERLRVSIRKIKQAAFDLSEALPDLKKEIEILLPDYHCAAALLYETEVQKQADALYASREILESYEDKKLVKTCLETATLIRALVEEHASANNISLDQLAGNLFSLHSEIRQWAKLCSETRDAVYKLSRCTEAWEGSGPDDLLLAFEQLRCEMASTRSALAHLEQRRRQFDESFDFVRCHPQIHSIWRDAGTANVQVFEDLLATGNAAISKGNDLSDKWASGVANFKGLTDSFSEGRYEDFLEELKQCPPHVRGLGKVTQWSRIAVERIERASQFLQSAKDEIRGKHWRAAIALAQKAEGVYRSQRLRVDAGRLQIAAIYGLLPTRLAWMVGVGTAFYVLSYWSGTIRWFLWLLTGGAAVPLLITFVMVVLNVSEMRRSGLRWRDVREVAWFFLLFFYSGVIFSTLSPVTSVDASDDSPPQSLPKA